MISLFKFQSIRSRILLIILIIPADCTGFVNPTTRSRSQIARRRWTIVSSEKKQEQQNKWSASDVYKDLDTLEQAINFTNAEQNLKNAERVEMLQHFAKQRRPLLPDVQKFVVAPLCIALFLRVLQEKSTIVNLISHMIMASMDFHFWLVVVMTPLLLLLAKVSTKPPPEPMPEELEALDPEYLEFVTTDWEDSRISCKDYTLFLLEYMVSAVAGMGLIGVLQFFKMIPTVRKNGTVALWLALSQLLTRVAVLASVYQYPRQLFELLRPQQPRPVGFFPFALQSLVLNLVAVAPLGIAFDLLKTLACMQREGVIALYTSISALLFGTWLRMQSIEKMGDFQKLQSKSLVGKLVQVVAILAFWKKPILNLHQKLQSFPIQKYITNWPRALLASSLASVVALLPIMSPLVHLSAIRKLFRVIYTHDLSLSMDVNDFKSCLENESEMRQRMKWRYRLEWRDERRLRPLLQDWNSGWGYWLLTKGTVSEKLNLEMIERKHDATMEGLRIFDRLKDDGMPNTRRDRWKRQAMKRLATKHQEDYDSKDYEDPLGVAIQQNFGIGLGFNFDHMSKLEEGETPSVRRLQARAAKSAIRRVQELYDPEAAKKELDRILDPVQRNQKAAELREQTEVEIKYLAKRLSELVPTGTSQEFEKKSYIQQFRQTGFKKKSSHEYTLDDPFANDSASEILFRREAKEESSGSDESVEFVDAYIQQRESDGDEDSNDDNNQRIVLA